MTDPPPPKVPRLGAAADVADAASAAAATAPGAAAAAADGAAAMDKVAAAPSTAAAAPAATAVPAPGAAAAAADGAPAGSAPAAAMAADTAIGEGGAGGGGGEGSRAPPPPSKLPRRGADADVAAAAAAAAVPTANGGAPAATTGAAAATPAAAAAAAAPPANGGAPAVTTGAAAATPAAAAAAPSAAAVVDDAPAKGDGAGARAPPAPPPSAASADGAVAEAAEGGPAAAADDGGRTGDAGAVAAAVGSIGVGGGAAAAPAGAAAGTAAAAAPSAAADTAAAAAPSATPSEAAGAGTTPAAVAAPPPLVAAKDAAVVAPPPAAAGGGGDAELHREAPVAAAYIVPVRKLPNGMLELNGGRPLYDAAAIDELGASSRVVHPAAEAAEAAAAEAAAAAATAPVAPVAPATDGEAAAAAGGAAEADTAAAAEGTPAGNGSGAAPVPAAVAGEAAPAVAAGTSAVTPQVASVNAAAAPAGAAAPPPDAAAPAAAAAADAAAPAAPTDTASPPAPPPPPGTKAAGFLHRDQAPDGSQSNFLSKELQVALRRRKVPFPRTAEVLKTLAARPRDRHGAVIPAAADGGGREPRAPRRVPDLTGKLYLAPLTTVGNTPFRRLCKGLGADVTCGEMALAANILQGQRSEWALLRRHAAEDVFGVQLAGNRKDVLARAAEVVARECAVDFVDLNCGCPLDMLTRKGAGAAMIDAPTKLADVVASVSAVVDVPLSVKLRTGRDERRPVAHTVIPALARAGASWFTVHGRSRTQRYSRLADWDYLTQACAPAAAAAGASLIPNGDVYAWEQAAPYMAGGDRHGTAGVSAVMIARGALIKPWLFTECAQRRHWDISATERLGLVADFARYGLDHWGADGRGREKTRKFLLEWLSFAYRYVPLGLLESPAGAAAAADAAAAAAAAAAWGPRLHHRSPVLRGRSDLETLLASPRPADWVRISELVLGAAPAGFTFSPKHGSHAWAADEVVNG